MSYFRLRLAPFLGTFLGLELLLRLALIVRQWHDIGWGQLGQCLVALLTGLGNDVAAFAYVLPLLALYLLALPRYRHGGRADRVLATGLFFVFATILLFTHASEWLFWDEFQTRFNFIAVDYLVYTHEVLANIFESYAVVPICAAIVAVAAVMAVLYRRWQRRAEPKIQRHRTYWRGRLGALVVALLLSLLSFFVARHDLVPLSNRYLDDIAYNGSFELFAAYRQNELSYDDFYITRDPAAAAPRLRQLLHLPGDGQAVPNAHQVTTQGKESHPNVILIMVESLSADYFATFGNTHHLTPHLDALAKESLFYANLYATGTRTVYGLSAGSLSIPPIPGNSIVRHLDNGGLATLGQVLDGRGYVSRFVYGGDGFFDNMNTYFSGNGYQIMDRKSWSKDEVTFENAWGLCDEDVFNKVLKTSDADFAAGKPFFDHIMTISNHRPFTYPDGKIDLPSKKGGRYGGVKYTDYAIDKFIKDAKTHPWFDNTIFVIIADHTAGSAGKEELTPPKYHIPLLIYAPKLVKPARDDTMASQIDMVPTLLGLMNLPYDSRFWGFDLRQPHPERAFISNYQKLGYMTPAGLVLLKPVKQAEYYTFATPGDVDSDLVPQSAVPADALDDAVAYYQGATHWRDWMRASQPK